MRNLSRPVVAVAIGALLAGCGHGVAGVAPNAGSPSQQQSMSQQPGPTRFFGAIRSDGSAEVCAPARAGEARCLALVQLGTPHMSGAVSPDVIPGYHPADLISAYKLPAGGSGQTIGIVDAYD